MEIVCLRGMDLVTSKMLEKNLKILNMAQKSHKKLSKSKILNFAKKKRFSLNHTEDQKDKKIQPMSYIH